MFGLSLSSIFSTAATPFCSLFLAPPALANVPELSLRSSPKGSGAKNETEVHTSVSFLVPVTGLLAASQLRIVRLYQSAIAEAQPLGGSHIEPPVLVRPVQKQTGASFEASVCLVPVTGLEPVR